LDAEVVPSAGFEPTTYRLGGDCSILLSYEGYSLMRSGLAESVVGTKRQHTVG
jgi:hypothetical protein